MRFLSLDLLAYGHFTGQTLVFPGDKGLFVVYGPNEAGKSTCLRALKGILFGIPKNTADGFLHDMPKLRIGATVMRSDGVRLSVVRRKGSKDTLLGEDGRSVSEDVLKPFLGGIDEDTFSRMFGISRDELVAGGRRLIEGGGGVGESLFAAGMGGVDLKGLIEALDQEASALFKPGGSTPVLNAAAREFKELKAKVREFSLPVQAWSELEATLADLTGKSDDLLKEISSLTEKKELLERIRDALPAISELKENRASRDSLGDVKLLSEDFTRRREQGQQDIARASEEEKTAQGKTEELERLLVSLQVPEALLAQGETIQGMVEELGSVRKSNIDLPRVQGQANEAVQTAKAILKELRPDLGLDDAAALRLTVERRQNIRALVDNHRTLAQQLTSAKDRIEEQISSIESAKRERDALKASKNVSDLERAVVLIRKKGELEVTYANALFDAQEARREAEEDAKSLPLWGKGDLEGLSTLQVPTNATIEEFTKRFDALDKNIEHIRDAIRTAEEKIQEIDGTLETLRLSREVPTEEDLARARARRERGWGLVRSAWLDGKRDEGAEKEFDHELSLDRAYERSVSDADVASDRMRREAEGVALKASLVAERARQVDTSAGLKAEEAELIEERAHTEEQWISRWSSTGIVPQRPSEMKDWRQMQEDLVRRAREIIALDKTATSILEQVEGCKNTLRDRLTKLGEENLPGGSTLEEMLHAAEAVIKHERDLASAREQLDRDISEGNKAYSKAQKEEQKAEEALAQWKKSWLVEVKGLSDTLTVDAATVYLDRCIDLAKKLEESEGHERRVDGMRRDIHEFTRKVMDFTTRYTPDLSGVNAEQVVVELSARVSTAKTDAATRTRVLHERTGLKKIIENAQSTIADARGRIAAFLKEAGCKAEEELPALETTSVDARRFDAKITELEGMIRTLASGRPVREFLEEAGRANPETIREDVRSLSARITQKQESWSTLNREIGAQTEKQNAMDGRGDAAEAAQASEEVLQRLRTNTEKYLVVRLARKALMAEVDRYREQNQGPALKRAAKIFRTVTDGRFQGLEPDYDAGDVPILVGVRGDAKRVDVYGMSDGTQDQLYLALRLATLENHLAENEPMPLVVDDALVNFDDDRAKASLKVLAELTAKTQVLFFTHHRHLVELAEQAVGKSVLHVQSL